MLDLFKFVSRQSELAFFGAMASVIAPFCFEANFQKRKYIEMIGEVFERNYEGLMAGRILYDAADDDTLICVDSEHEEPAARYILLRGKKECFYECLRRMDRFAKKHCGRICAIFSVESHTATIQVTLSSMRFEDWEDCDLLAYVASHAASVSVKNENGSDVLLVNVECFALVPNDSDVKWSLI